MSKAVTELFNPNEILDSRGVENANVSQLTLSSTEAGEGALFFAVRGSTVDSHQYCKKVLEQGAAAVVVEDAQLFAELSRAVLVRSTRAILGKVADRFWKHPSRQVAVVAVTGTNGKTTVTHLLEQAWTAAGLSSGLVGTIRYQVGSRSYPSPLTTPDALSLQKLWSEMAQVGVRFAAVEASSIALDQYRLTGTKLRAAVFTNLTQDHLDYHGTMETYYESKRRLFTEFRPEIAVINVDDAWGQKLDSETKALQKLRFSVTGQTAEFQLKSFRTGSEFVEAELICLGKKHRFQTRLLGRHNLANILASTATLVGLGWDVEGALELLSQAPGAPGRLERVGIPGACEVLVDYAHSEDALEQVLRSLDDVRRARGGRIVTVFGCGGDRDKTKRPKMAEVVSHWSDVSIVTSDNPRTENPDGIIDEIETGVARSKTEYLRETDRRLAIHKALQLSRPEDVLLIAGKGHENYQIIGKEKFPFDDREVVREFFHRAMP